MDNPNNITENPELLPESIRTIRSNAQHLLTILNDILDMSKIEAGRMTIESISTSPVDLVEEVAAILRPRAEGKSIELKTFYPTSLPMEIRTDPTRVRQILMNLVGNAIKFTEIGNVTIQVDYHEDKKQIQFSVIDSGIGMSIEQLEVVSRFDAFSQADGSTTRKFGGSGLGLRISNSLARILGGTISVKSQLGRGSVFALNLPVNLLGEVELVSPLPGNVADNGTSIIELPSAGNLDQDTDLAPLSGLHVLLVEDGLDNQRLISFHLKKAGANVTIAEHGKIAIEIIEQKTQTFDVVIMDMQMPVLDGYETTTYLRASGFCPPILALTAHAMEGERQKCLDAGCDEYLTKPIDRQILIDTVKRYSQTHKGSMSLMSSLP